MDGNETITEEAIDNMAEELAEEVIERSFTIGERNVTLQKNDGGVSACVDNSCHEFTPNGSLFDSFVRFLDNLISPSPEE